MVSFAYIVNILYNMMVKSARVKNHIGSCNTMFPQSKHSIFPIHYFGFMQNGS